MRSFLLLLTSLLLLLPTLFLWARSNAILDVWSYSDPVTQVTLSSSVGTLIFEHRHHPLRFAAIPGLSHQQIPISLDNPLANFTLPRYSHDPALPSHTLYLPLWLPAALFAAYPALRLI